MSGNAQFNSLLSSALSASFQPQPAQSPFAVSAAAQPPAAAAARTAGPAGGRGPSGFRAAVAAAANDRDRRGPADRRHGAPGGGRDDRRPVVTFEDRDGDLSMGSDSARAAGRERRGTPYGRRPPAHQHGQPGGNQDGPRPQLALRTAVLVRNVDPATPMADLVKFITNKARSPVAISEARWLQQPKAIIVELKDADQARAVRELSGIFFSGVKLEIQYTTSRQTSPDASAAENDVSMSTSAAPQTGQLDKLRALVRSRYVPEARRLDFDRIQEDPFVRQERLRVFDHSNPTSKIGQVLCKLFQEICPELETLSLAGNRLRTLDHFSTLHERIPNLVNLSLQDNLLSSFRDLEPLRGKELRLLREFVLIGNPVREREVTKAGGEIKYTSNIKRMFPSIQILDMQPMIEEIQFNVMAASAKLPVSVKPGFMDSDSTASMAQQFLQMFYTLFDSNRAGLEDLYTDTAIFTLSINQTRLSSGKSGTFQGEPRRNERTFEAWFPFNRNLERLKQADKRVSMAHIGPKDIIATFGQIPGTRHPLTDPPERRRFLVEAFPGVAPSNYIHITVHGEFTEVATSEKRSFDRTFILVPAAPGSRAARMNLPCAIANDAWIVRYYTGNYAWSDIDKDQEAQPPMAPQPLPASLIGTVSPTVLQLPAPPMAGATPATQQWPQLPDPMTLEQYRIQNGLHEQQHAMVIEFAKATGLNYAFSLMCLREMSWSFEAAGQAFLQAKGNIPPEAFQL
nr:nuclear mRNA export, poly(A)+RNA binding protein [Polyrhizophydium stewartii]